MSIDLLTNPWVEQEPCREEDPRFRAGKQTLLCRSFPQLPRRRPSRGEVNSSKYLAAEEAILHAEGATQSSSVQWDDVWIEDIRACLSNEPDPAWSIWPAWKELVASAQPLHDTLRAIEISEFVSQSHEAGRPPPPETRIASAVPRSARTARLSRPPLWPTERMTPPVRAPLKHALCVANRPNVAVQGFSIAVDPSFGTDRSIDHSIEERAGSIAGRITQALLSNDERAEEWDGNDDEVDKRTSAEKPDEETGEKTPNRRRFKSVVRKMQVKNTAANALVPHAKGCGANGAPVDKFGFGARMASMRQSVGGLLHETPISPASNSVCEEIGPDFRLMDRRGAFGQSRGHWLLHNIMSRTRSACGKPRDTMAEVSTLLLEDWYHTFLDAKIGKQLCCFLVLYVVLFWFYAFLYLGISKACNLQLEGHLVKAYLLSLETMMTIGYGVPDPYMNGCWQGPFVLTTQVLVNLILSAILIGVIFQGIARPQSRACTILCSEKAIIRCIDGAYYFMFRVCDLRSQHSLVEPHIRCYCVEQSDIRGFETTQMRLLQPDDELGATLLLSMPSIVVHRIDAWSPLAPHRPDLYGPAPLAPPSPMGDEPLPHVESALAKAQRHRAGGEGRS
ncbi:Inward rectifier potassium channel 18 (Inward rectifier K(+) channel Kir2.6) (Potassium channel [Durusdinium trenchii]|uniref:Inwardly rectifying subfamily J member 18 n=1 Tax=Durusdinium trenchii TaxID=1381693 RepID=A0ABP0QAE7_9DINO